MNVIHIIIGLNVGGAELMLKRLIISQQGKSKYRHSVISITNLGKVGEQLQSAGVEVRALGMRSMVDAPRVLWQLVRSIRASRADVVQTWMYHADLLGGVAARLAGKRNVIWGIRGSAIPQRGLSATKIVMTLCSFLSRYLPSVIICCADSAKTAHAEKGYDQRKLTVIPNGYELAYLNMTAILRQQARKSFGFNDGELVVGIVGRFDPLKDYRNFVRAAAIVASKVERVRFLMVGRGIDGTNQALNGWISENGFAANFVLAGERNDIPHCLAAMDVFCLSSYREGFPNVVCEAMAMKVPCVVTDAGDAGKIVSDIGIVVPPGDSIALAKALHTMICKDNVERSALGERARKRVEEHYSIEAASARYGAIYQNILNKNTFASI